MPQTNKPHLQQLLDVMKTGDYIVLDTETTGLQRGEICQIALIDPQGTILLDTLVKPVGPIPADATRVHQLRDDDVATAPGWAEVSPQVQALVTGHPVITYNAIYDRKMLHQSAEAAQLPRIEWKTLAPWYCAMEAYAEYYGEWNAYYGNYRWQRLTDAVQQCGLVVKDAHTALGDCQMTLAVMQYLFNQSPPATV